MHQNALPPFSHNFLTVRQLSLAHPSFSEGSLRWLLFNANRNGFAACVRRVGRRVLIDEQAFVNWVNGNGAALHGKGA